MTDANICFLTEKDVSAFNELLNICFPGSNSFPVYWAHLCNSNPENFKNHILVKEGDAILAHIGIGPLKMKLPGALLSVAGVGAVATHPESRGKGYMQLLFGKTEKMLTPDKYDIAWLGGDRKRYNNFGYENGGRNLKVVLQKRSVKAFEKNNLLTVKDYDGSDEMFADIRKMHLKEMVGLLRSEKEDRINYSRGHKIKVLYKNNSLLAYAVYTISNNVNWPSTLHECGGEDFSLGYLLSYIFATDKPEKMIVPLPAFNCKYRKFFIGLASNWYLDTTKDGMIKIINLPSMMKKFSGQMSERVKGLGLKKTLVKFEIPELKQEVTLEIGAKVKVTKAKTKNIVSLNRRDMVRFLFGVSKPSDEFKLDEKLKVLDVVLPLDIFFWQLEVV